MAEKQRSAAEKAELEDMADELMRLARDTITVRFRFFDAPLHRLKVDYWHGLGGVCMRGETLSIDPAFLLKKYIDEPGIVVRLYLHVLMHMIFFHPFQYDKMQENYWNLATDLAVENIIQEMNFAPAALSVDGQQADKLYALKKRVGQLTAEKIYREFLINGISQDLEKEYVRLFTIDDHNYWHAGGERDEVLIDEEDWKKITRRIRTELKAFSRGRSAPDAFEKNVDEAMRTRYNYREILQKFMVREEEMTVNDDEFDYVYYTYGLSLYGNLPLVEPLEYRENHKIRDFVIALDTSASCQGETIKKFVRLTYQILKQSENFFRKVNIHIIQCDNKVQMDTKITCDSDFEEFMKHGKVKGFGDTDFVPVFTYVDALKQRGEFTDLKGLIYFTDGYGFYPPKMPEYDVIFAFLNEDEKRPPVPGWALQVVMEDDLNEYQ